MNVRLSAPIDDVMVTGPGPHYRPLIEIGFDQARLAISENVLMPRYPLDWDAKKGINRIGLMMLDECAHLAIAN